MANYTVENTWGDDSKHPGGTWVLGDRPDQAVESVLIFSNDHGQTFGGIMTYAGEGPIGFHAKHLGNNRYEVKNQWGGPDAPWNPAGTWVIGGRPDQRCVALNFVSYHEGKMLRGNNTYKGEGPIGFDGTLLLIP